MLPTIYIIGAITDDMAHQLSAQFTLCYDSALSDRDAWLAKNGAGIKYVVTNGHDGIADDILAQMPDVALISNYGVGYDAINVELCAAKGIIVTHTPDVLNQEVATTALLLMLACYRELRANDEHARSGQWEKTGSAPLSRSADNRTVGIIGLGRIGSAIAAKLAPFGATILYHGRTAKDVSYKFYPDLVEMAQDSDVLVTITPGGKETENLVTEQVLEALGPSGLFLNLSRGSVVDEAALVRVLQDGRLGGAGLDVFAQEPHIPEALRAMDNVVLTPHIGSATFETRAAMGQLVVDNVLQHNASGEVFTPSPETASIALVKKR